MKKTLILSLLLLYALALSAQSYSSLWKKVGAADRADRPQTALSLCRDLRTKALREGNDAQLLKATLMCRLYGGAVSPDSALVYIDRMETALAAETREVTCALWHAALACTYLPANNRYGTIGGMTAEEMRQRSRQHFLSSLAAPDVLAQTSADQYLPLFQKGADSRYFGYDLLHVLAETSRQSGVLSEEEVGALYRRQIAVYDSLGRAEAVLLLTLDSLQLRAGARRIEGALADHALYRQLADCEARFAHCENRYRVYESMVKLRYRYEAESPFAEANDSLLLAKAQQGLALLGKDKRAGCLRGEVQDMLNPTARLTGWGTLYYPADTLTLQLSARHLQRVELRLTRLYDSTLEADNAAGTIEQRAEHLRGQATSLFRDLPTAPPYRWQTASWQVQLPEQPGVYAAQLVGDGQLLATHRFQVSALRALTFSAGSDYHRVVVLDSRSGRPVPHVRITACQHDMQGKLRQVKAYQTDEKGVLELGQAPTGARNRLYYPSLPSDKASPSFGLYPVYYNLSQGDGAASTCQVDLFADRAIYRPGQVVHFSGVVYTRQGDHCQAVPGYSCTVRLYNASRKAVDSLLVSTDRLGNFGGSFTLPAVCLPGTFTLQTDGAGTQHEVLRSAGQPLTMRRGWLGIQVEEYKRPTFTAETKPVEQAFVLGDTVRVQGEALTYTRVPVAGALVQYTVRRLAGGYGPRTDTSHTVSDTTRTDERGCFVLPVHLSVPSSSAAVVPLSGYRYAVSYTVTASQGETVQGEFTLRASRRKVWIEPQVPKAICRERIPDLLVEQTNAAGQPILETGRYRLLDAGGNEVCADTFLTARPFRPAVLASLPSATYIFCCSTPSGGASDSLRFVLMSETDRRPADRHTPLSVYQRPGQGSHTAWLQVGTPLRDATLFYDLVTTSGRVDHRTYHLTDTLFTLQLDWQPAWGDCATACFALVRDGKLHTFQTTVSRPEPDRRLKVEYASFRSRLQPGSSETWRLRITHPDGTPADASLLARIYDASLDALTTSHWRFSSLGVSRQRPALRWSWQPGGTGWPQTLEGAFAWQRPTCVSPVYMQWDERLFASSYGGRIGRGVKERLMRRQYAMASNAPALDLAECVVEDEAGGASLKKVAPSASAGESHETAPATTVRSQFQETACFRPALHTDARGEVTLQFTWPESVTRWRFTALAHDVAMNYGSMDTTLVVRKLLMAQLSLPRFVRAADRVQLPVTVTNLTDSVQQARVCLTVSKASLPDSVLFTSVQTVRLQAGEVRTVYAEWQLSFAESSLLVCRAVAQAGAYSDGEERLLPVLSPTVQLTRTLPFSLHGREAGEWRIDSLFPPSAQPLSLTVETTAQPLWYAVGALPSLAGTPRIISATEWGNRYYALALAQALAKQHPEIRQWLHDYPAEADTLARLKEALLTDLTPWWQAGQAEAQRIRSLRGLFDEETAAAHRYTALDQLRSLQLPDGSWSWYRGMKGHASITVEVAILLARTERLAGLEPSAHSMLESACRWLQGEAARQVSRMKQREAQHHVQCEPTEWQLRYLYLRALLGQKPDADARYLMTRAQPLRHRLTLYGKALAVRVLQQAGQKDRAAEVLQSLREYTVSTPEMGCYFDSPRAEWSATAYRIPTQCAAIEAFEAAGDTLMAQSMRLWLLQAKRTQQWDTPLATADAVWNLLQQRLPAQGGALDYTISQQGHTVANSSEAHVSLPASLGYVRQVYQAETPDSAVWLRRTGHVSTSLRVTHQGDGLAWGSVYATSVIPADSVPVGGNGLQLEVRTEVQRGTQWQPLSAQTVLHPGDRVRQTLLVHADRDYDFVSFSSSRPACMEPVQSLSGYRLTGSLWAYTAVHDDCTEHFVEQLQKGDHRLVEEWWVGRAGRYAAGISRVSSVYAPEFSGTAHGQDVIVEER